MARNTRQESDFMRVDENKPKKSELRKSTRIKKGLKQVKVQLDSAEKETKRLLQNLNP